jgi:hypothetical protein
MSLVFASEFGSRLDILEQKKKELKRLLDGEFHPKRIQGLIDQLREIDVKIRMEKKKYSPRGI